MIVAVGERGAGGGGVSRSRRRSSPLSPLDGRSPREPAGGELRVLVELPRPALADRDDLDALSPDDQRDYVRSLEREGAALRSALGARGVDLRDAVTFGRTWDGFAATVDTSDLAALSSLGVRAQPVRRFYPATSEPVPVPGEAPKPRAAPAGQAPVAVLDSGAAPSASGYDALDRDGDPAPGATRARRGGARRPGPRSPGSSRRRGSGSCPCASPATAGRSRRSTATTDALLLGLERVRRPRRRRRHRRRRRASRWSASTRPTPASATRPRPRRRGGAAKLGTLVVAPAGNEGAGAAAERRRRLAGRGAVGAGGRGDRGRRGRRAGRRDDRRAHAPARRGARRRAARARRWPGPVDAATRRSCSRAARA